MSAPSPQLKPTAVTIPPPASPKITPAGSTTPAATASGAGGGAAAAKGTPTPTADSKDSKSVMEYGSNGSNGSGGANVNVNGLGPVCNLYGLENYTFGEKEAMHEKEQTPKARFDRLASEFQSIGMRRTVEAILLVHNHGHPHILLLQIGNNLFKL